MRPSRPPIMRLYLVLLALPLALLAQTDTRTAQTISFPPLSARTYGAAPVALGATASSNLPVSYAVVSGHGRIDGTSLVIEGGGVILVEATQPGNATYAPAAPVRQTLTVAPIQVRITVPSGATTFTGSGHAADKRLAIVTDPPIASALYTDPSLFVYYGDQLVEPYQFGSARSSSYQYPFAVGKYVVRATIMSPRERYAGTAVGSFEITRAPVTLTLGNLTHTHDGQPKSATVTASPDTHQNSPESASPMSSVVRITYNGSTTPPTAAGSYQVVATVDSPNYVGSTTATLTISDNTPATPPPSTPPTPTAPPPTTTTPPPTSTPPPPTTPPPTTTPPSTPPPSPATPPSPTPPPVVTPPPTATPPPSAPVTAAVVLTNLIQTADGAARVPVVTTNPPGLATRITYNGSPTPPTTAGTYNVVATITAPNYVGSASATLTVNPLTPTGLVGPLPSIAEQPRAASASPGQPATLSVRIESAGPVTYQWFRDGAAIPGATDATLTTDLAGTYTVVITNSGGSVTSTAAALALRAPTRLANVSTRGRAGASSEPLIAGFVISGTETKQMLIRAAGPALRPFGVADAIARPHLQLFRGDTLVADNTRWNVAPNAGELSAAARSSGAFDFAVASDDSALLLSLPPGAYTALVTNTDAASGSALAEVYEVTASSARLVNLSTRATFSGPADALIAGFVVSGDAPRRVLVRAVGPALAAFAVGHPLADPLVKLHRGDTVLAENRGWSDAANIRDASAQVGAFALPPGSRDAALLLELAPGPYTVHLSSQATQNGTVLLELYELP